MNADEFKRHLDEYFEFVHRQFRPWVLERFETGGGDQFGYVFKGIKQILAAISQFQKEISETSEEEKYGWATHFGAACALFEGREPHRNNVYPSLAVTKACCDHDANNCELLVSEDFVKQCDPQYQDFFSPVDGVTVAEKDNMTKRKIRKQVYIFDWHSYSNAE